MKRKGIFNLIVILSTILFHSCEDKLLTPITENLNDDISLDISISPVGIRYFDSYSNSNLIKVFWEVSKVSNDLLNPEVYDIDSVKIYLSQTGPYEGYRQYFVSAFQPKDSIVVGNLQQNQFYYFRLALTNEKDSLVGLSKPLMTTLGESPPKYFTENIKLKDLPIYHTNLSWSTIRDELAIIKNDDLGKVNMFVWNKDTKIFNKITDYTGSNYRLMSLSFHPKERYVCYSYTPSSTYAELDYKICKINLVNGVRTSLSHGRIDSDPYWFSENNILFCKGTHAPPNIPELYLLDLNNGNEIALTNDQYIYKYFPSVSEDQTTIVYSGRTDSKKFLYLTDFEGTSQSRLTEFDYWNELHPSFVNSKNSREIYFTSDRSGHYEIWSVNLDNKQLKQITFSEIKRSNNYYGKLNSTGQYLAVIMQKGNFEFSLVVYNQ